jgi:IS4 transposase
MSGSVWGRLSNGSLYHDFLTTDSQLDDEKILEVYALRWGIEIYFKEAKQKLGFLKE